MGRLRDKISKFEQGLIPLDDEIRTHIEFTKEVERLKGKIEAMDLKEIIDARYRDLREYYKRKDAFNILEKELKQEGIDPEGFLGDDYLNFSRAFTKRETVRNKKK